MSGTPAAAVIVRCADAGAGIWNTLRSIERQTVPAEVVLVVDPSTPSGTRSWVRAVAESRGHRLVAAPGDRPAVVKNAGIRATTAPSFACVDAGCELHTSFLEQTVARLAGADTAAVATWVERIGPGTRVRVEGPAAVTLAECLSNSDLVDGTALVRRSDWSDAGGFDETLPSLDALDLWLSLLGRGRALAVVHAPLVTYIVERNAAYRRAWDADTRGRAIAHLLQKHRAAFDAHVAGVLADREARLLPLAHQFRPLLARRDASLAEAHAAEERVRELLGGARAPLVPVSVGLDGRATPVARDWGFSRGTPVDRYYINAFLESCADDVHGVVLDVQEADNARRIGGDRVARVDVVDVDGRNASATVTADLRCAPNIASASYDCIVLTQTLHLIDDMRAVVTECARLLRPGGVLLVTMPCASRVANDYGPAHDHWRATAAGARRLFAECFGPDLRVDSWGNAATTSAFLYGLAVHELSQAALDFTDPHYPMLVTVRAQKR